MRGILACLIIGIDLALIHDNATCVKVMDHSIQRRRIGRFLILNHNKLANLLIETHTRDIESGQLFVAHMSGLLKELTYLLAAIDVLCKDGVA